MGEPRFQHAPAIWHGLGWALRSPQADTRGRLALAARMAWGLVSHPVALGRWMAVAWEMHSRGLLHDLPAEFLRAVRPYVHRGLSVQDRAVALIDHVDWLAAALAPVALKQLGAGQPVVLASLAAPRGYEAMRLQLQRAPAHSPEGELRLTLSLQREARVQAAPPVEVAVLGFSCFRVEGRSCLVIGGVRGQRHPSQRLSPQEVAQALSGWKAPVLMIRVAQEMAHYWGLHLVGLDPAWHPLNGPLQRLSARQRDTAQRISEAHNRLWTHFAAQPGPAGWVLLPAHSDDRLEATALSPETRARQIQRADFWIRTANLLRHEFRGVLLQPDPHARAGRSTENQTLQGMLSGYDDSRYAASSVLHSIPGSMF